MVHFAVAGFDYGVGVVFCFTSTTVFVLPNGLFLARSTKIGAATNMEEYVPVITPINIANAKPLVTSPPTRNKIRMVRNTVNDVIMVRLSV